MRRASELTRIDRWPAALALGGLAASILSCWRLGAVGLVQMEGMVVDGARAMLRTGDWVVPRVYGEIYTFKPALAYWLAALPESRLEPAPEWLLRLPFAASAVVMALAVQGLVGRVAGPRVGLLSGLASISSFLFLQKVRLAEYDTPLAVGVGIAVAAACVNLASREARGGVWLLGYLALSFGFLAKGVPALMAYAPGLVAAALVTRRVARLLDRRHLAAAALFGALVGGYLFVAYQSAGPAAFAQPLGESRVRGLGWLDQKAGDVLPALGGAAVAPSRRESPAPPLATLARNAAKPVYVWLGFFPWTVLLPFAFARRATATAAEAPRARLLASGRAFLLAGLLAFMATPTHEMRYYLPLAVPVGILCGAAAGGAARLDLRRRRWMLAAAAAAAALVAALTALAGLLMASPPVPPTHRKLLVAFGLLALALIPVVVCGRRRGRVAILMLLAVTGSLAAESLGFQLVRASKRDLRHEARVLERYLPPREAVWVLGPPDVAGKDASLLYYLRRPVWSFGAGGKLPPPDAYCLLPADRLAELPRGGAGLRFLEIARIDHPRRDYLLGLCSRPGGRLGTAAGQGLSP